MVTQNETGFFERSISAPTQEAIPRRIPNPPNDKKIGAPRSSSTADIAPLNVPPDERPNMARYAARYTRVAINQIRVTSRRSGTVAVPVFCYPTRAVHRNFLISSVNHEARTNRVNKLIGYSIHAFAIATNSTPSQRRSPDSIRPTNDCGRLMLGSGSPERGHGDKKARKPLALGTTTQNIRQFGIALVAACGDRQNHAPEVRVLRILEADVATALVRAVRERDLNAIERQPIRKARCL